MTYHEQLRNLFTPEELIVFPKARGHAFSQAFLHDGIVEMNSTDENLFEVVDSMDRYVVDPNTNQPWQKMSAKSAHKSKAFIIGKAATDENFNTLKLFFSKDLNLNNRNVFVLHITGETRGTKRATLERVDDKYRLLFKPESLVTGKDREDYRKKLPYFNKWESDHIASVAGERKDVLALLEVESVAELAAPENCKSLMEKLRFFIQENKNQCFRKWLMASMVARYCYALMVAENLNNARNELADETDSNVFGDTQFVRDALFLNANIFSNDGACRSMAKYVDLKCVNGIW